MSHEEGYNFKYFICAWCKAIVEKETKKVVVDPSIDIEKISSHGMCPKCYESQMAAVIAA